MEQLGPWGGFTFQVNDQVDTITRSQLPVVCIEEDGQTLSGGGGVQIIYIPAEGQNEALKVDLTLVVLA